MCNECEYCGAMPMDLRIDADDHLTCRACCNDDDEFFAMITLSEWSAARRDEADERGEWLRDQQQDRLDGTMSQVGFTYRGGSAVAAANAVIAEAQYMQGAR